MGSAGNPAVFSLLPASFITKSDDAITPAGRRGQEVLTNGGEGWSRTPDHLSWLLVTA
jgi:hypothetical protein